MRCTLSGVDFACVSCSTDRDSSALAPDRAARLEAYRQIIAFYNVEETVFWSRNNLLVVLQGALFTALLTMASGKSDLTGAVSPALAEGTLCAMGFGMAAAWILMVRRSVYIFAVISEAVRRAESALGFDEESGPLQYFDKCLIEPSLRPVRIGKRNRRPLVRLSNVWTGVGAGFAILWCLAGGAIIWSRHAASSPALVSKVSSGAGPRPSSSVSSAPSPRALQPNSASSAATPRASASER